MPCDQIDYNMASSISRHSFPMLSLRAWVPLFLFMNNLCLLSLLEVDSAIRDAFQAASSLAPCDIDRDELSSNDQRLTRDGTIIPLLLPSKATQDCEVTRGQRMTFPPRGPGKTVAFGYHP